jgi:hypothetical protein
MAYPFRPREPVGNLGDTPSETWRFAQALLGEPPRSGPQAADDARARLELLQWVAQIAPERDQVLRERERAEAQAAATREQLEWLASFSPRHERELERLRAAEAQAALVQSRVAVLNQEQELLEAGWDPGKHPRRGGAPNAGWFARTGGRGDYGTSSSGEERSPTPHMLSLAGEWWDTKDALDQNRRNISHLTNRVASERAQLGAGGRYTYVHAQNLAKAERDLAAAKADTPKLESKLKDLEQKYKDSGYDDIPHHAWTAGETIVGGRGIENVGRAVGTGSSPAGATPTNDEVDLGMAGVLLGRLGVQAIRGLASKSLAGAALPKGFDIAKGFATFEDFKDVFGTAGPGNAWHHVVEQTINSGRFSRELLHNPANLLRLPHGKGSVHAKVSGYYSSKLPGLTGDATVREWLSKKSFKEQFEFAIDAIKKAGGSQYLPPHLR